MAHQNKLSIPKGREEDFIKGLSFPILILDDSGNTILNANAAALDFFQKEKGELLGMAAAQLCPERVFTFPAVEYLDEQFQKAQGGENPHFDWIFEVDEEKIEAEVRVFPYYADPSPFLQLNILPRDSHTYGIEAGRVREERLHLMVKKSGIGCYDWYPLQDYLFWDEQMYQLFGLDPDSSTDPNDHFSRVMHSEDRERMEGAFRDIVKASGNRSSFSDKYRIQRGEQTIYIFTTGYIFRDQENRVIRMIGSCQDVSQYEQNKKKLELQDELIREKMEQFRLAIRTAKLGIWTLDLDSGKLEWNDELFKIYGITREEFEQDINAWRDQLHPEDSDYANSRFQEIFEGKRVFDVEFRIIRPDGEIRCLNASGAPSYNREGEMVGLIGVNIDVSHIKEKDREIKEREERLSLIYNNTSDLMALLKVEGNELIFSSINEPFLKHLSKLLGKELSEEAFRDASLRNYLLDKVKISKEDFHLRLKNMERCIQSKSKVHFSSEGEIQGKKHYFQHEVTPILVKGECQFLLWTHRDTTDKKTAELRLQQAMKELNHLKSQLEKENTYLRKEINLNFEKIIYQSEAFAKVLEQVQQVAPTDANVLISGETGTGKELLARAIHLSSSRAEKPMIKVNCGAIPDELIESELFGYEKGAFSGAEAQKVGRFDLAHEGTLFLDEIGEVPMSTQVKLLRVLQEHEFERLGATETTRVDVRILAATNRDLEEEVKKGNFRQDLYYRLNVFPIRIPPLRKRKEDIPLLARHFLSLYAKKYRKNINDLSGELKSKLLTYPWPGNVRELQNTMERAVILSREGRINLDELDQKKEDNPPLQWKDQSLDEVMKAYMKFVLEQANWKIEGEEGAASILKLKPSTLRDKMKKLDIKRPKS